MGIFGTFGDSPKGGGMILLCQRLLSLNERYVSTFIIRIFFHRFHFFL
jgi:hypothetical protein